MNRTRSIAAVLLVLVVTAGFAPMVAVAQEQGDGDSDTTTTNTTDTNATIRGAELAIDQPRHVDEAVGDPTSTEDGTPLYEAKGAELILKPMNFDSGDVQSYGVVEDGGSMAYDEQMDFYRLSADADGTYTVYWIVEEQVEVEAENGNGTTTETREVRYEAAVQTAGTGGTWISEERLSEMKNQSSLAEQLLGEMERLGYYDSSSDDPEKFITHVVKRYHLYTSPFAALSGSYTALMIGLVTSIGGLIIVIKFTSYHTVAMERIRRRLNIYESIEAEEGKLANRAVEMDDRERRNTTAKIRPGDIVTDAAIAEAATESLGETLLDAETRYLERIRPYNILHDRLQAMGQSGWMAAIHRDDDGTIESVKIVDEEPDEDVEVDDLSHPSEELMENIEDTRPVREFDLSDADVNVGELETEINTLDLDEVSAELELETEHISTEEWGEYLLEFWESVREHPDVRPDGRPDTLRLWMGHMMKQAQVADERYQHPVAEYLVDAHEAALKHHDPVEEAREQLDSLRTGEYND